VNCRQVWDDFMRAYTRMADILKRVETLSVQVPHGPRLNTRHSAPY
jgi:hypothetical protein